MSEENTRVHMIVRSASVMTVPIDDSLSVAGEAADAKAVGDALALKADLSSVNTIKVNEEEADNQGQILIDGTGIPVSGTDTRTLAAAVASAEGRTGADIPVNGDPGAQMIAEVLAESVDKTADQIAMSESDSTTVAERILSLETGTAGSVKSVNSQTPDDTGNVELTRVPYADNLLSSGSQSSDGAFLIRSTGGDASISDGDARISAILGNIVHTGYTAESIAPTVSGSFEVSIDRATFVGAASGSGTFTFEYDGESWDPEISTYGITIASGSPAANDSISVVYVEEVRGTITAADPQTFVSTGWNLYNAANGYARVVKYSDAYGFRVGGTYTAISFSTTVDGAQTLLTVTSRNFSLPAGVTDGYIFVTGADATTEIYMTWSDWTTQANGGVHRAYTQNVINLSGIMSGAFPYGLLAVGDVRDEISFANRKTYSRIEKLDYTDANRTYADSTGRAYEVDEYNIYLVRASAVETTLAEGMGQYSANGHGIEFFTGTSIAPEAHIVYSNDLKNKLERDVLTISQQTLTDAQQEQVRENIGAASNSVLISPTEVSLSVGTQITIDDISPYNVVLANFYAINNGMPRIFGVAIPKRFIDSSKGISTTYFNASLFYSASHFACVGFSIDSNTQITIRDISLSGYSSIKGICMYGMY